MKAAAKFILFTTLTLGSAHSIAGELAVASDILKEDIAKAISRSIELQTQTLRTSIKHELKLVIQNTLKKDAKEVQQEETQDDQ